MKPYNCVIIIDHLHPFGFILWASEYEWRFKSHNVGANPMCMWYWRAYAYVCASMAKLYSLCPASSPIVETRSGTIVIGPTWEWWRIRLCHHHSTTNCHKTAITIFGGALAIIPFVCLIHTYYINIHMNWTHSRTHTHTHMAVSSIFSILFLKQYCSFHHRLPRSEFQLFGCVSEYMQKYGIWQK